MPFISQDRREMLASPKIAPLTLEPGDLCYIHYKEMLDNWRTNPRWTTAHAIFRDMVLYPKLKQASKDNDAARALAWQVFFNLHVLPYEIDKRARHGEVE